MNVDITYYLNDILYQIQMISNNELKFIFFDYKGEKKLFGGIVINTDARNYHGRWIYFDKPSKLLKDNDFANWQDLDF